MSEIKVGSEWVWMPFNSVKEKGKVVFVSSKSVLIALDNRNEELWGRMEFLTYFKPAPVRRTVWLNVYERGVAPWESKREADNMRRPDVLFQQEVELIDPRGETPA